MANAIGARKGPFLLEFPPIYPVRPLVVLSLEYSNDTPAERRQILRQQAFSMQYLVPAGMSEKIGQLQARDIVRLGFDLQFATRDDLLELDGLKILGALFPYPTESSLEAHVFFAAARLCHDVTHSAFLAKEEYKSFQ
jgi:hypothetical protein